MSTSPRFPTFGSGIFARMAILFCIWLFTIPAIASPATIPTGQLHFSDGSWTRSDIVAVKAEGDYIKIEDRDTSAHWAESPKFDVTPFVQVDATVKVTQTTRELAQSGVAIGIRFYASGNATPVKTTLKFVTSAAGQAGDANVSATIPPGATAATLFFYTGAGALADGRFEQPRVTGTAIDNLGKQVSMVRSTVSAFDGSDTLYIALSGSPALLAIYDTRGTKGTSNSPRVTHEFPKLPSQEVIWSIAVATDRSVYIGTASGRLYRYQPSSRTQGTLTVEHNFGADTIIYALRAGANGDVYGGLARKGVISKGFNYQHGRSDALRDITVGPTVGESLRYVRSLAVDNVKRRVFWGAGTNAAVYTSAFEAASATAVVDSSDAFSYAYYTDYASFSKDKGRLFVTMTSNSTSETRVYDESGRTMQTFSAINSLEISAVDSKNRVFYTKKGSSGSSTLFYYNLNDDTEVETGVVLSQPSAFYIDPASPDLLVVCLRLHGRIVTIDLNALGSKEEPVAQENIPHIELVLPETGVDIRAIGVSPDIPGSVRETSIGAKLFMSLQIEKGLAIRRMQPPLGGPPTILLNPVEDLQPEGFTVAGKTLYAGLYPGAIIKAYDITADSVKKLDIDLSLPAKHGQARPFAMLAVPEYKKLIVGTVPEVGISGALAIGSTEPGGPAWDFRRPVVIGDPHAEAPKKITIEGQTIMALANVGSVVFGGTSTWGAQGEFPLKDEKATLFSFDLVPGRSLPKETRVDAPVISSLITVDKSVWGLAGNLLLIAKPGEEVVSRKLALLSPTPRTWEIAWFAGQLARAKNGYVYVSTQDNLYRIPETNPDDIELVIDGAVKGAVQNLVVDERGDLYYKRAGELFLLDLPD